MVRMGAEFRWYGLEQLRLDGVDLFARCQAGPVGNPEDVSIDRDRRLSEGHVEHDIGRLPADSWKGLQRGQ